MRSAPLGTRYIAYVEDAGEASPLFGAAIAIEGQTYLVEIEPYNSDTGTAQLNYSDTGYTSPQAGLNPNVHYEGRVSQPLRMSWGLPVVPEAQRRVALEISNTELINTDGALDSYIDNYDIGGRPIRVLFGLKTYPYGNFNTIWTGRALSWVRDFSRVQITARDNGYLLDVPFQTEFYGGTGDADGDSSLAGRPKPIALGCLKGVQPVLINAANLIYQVNFRGTHGDPDAGTMPKVYDKGVPLIFDYASSLGLSGYFDVLGTSVSPGHFIYSLTLGLMKLGAAPVGIVTMDLVGDAVWTFHNEPDPAPDFWTVQTWTKTGELFVHALDLAGISGDLIDADSANNLDASIGAKELGYYLDGQQVVQVSDVLTALMASTSSWWGALPDGRFSVGRIEAPDEDDVQLELQAWDIKDIQIIAPPQGAMPPRFRQRLTYNRKWTALTASDLAGVLTAEEVQDFTSPFSIATSEDSGIQSDFLLAQDKYLETLFSDGLTTTGEDAAQDEADRLLALLGVQRQTVRVTLDTLGHLVPRDACLALTHRRINGGARWVARIIGADIDADGREVALILWG